MLPALVVFGVLIFAVAIFLFAGRNPEKKRQNALHALAHLLESSVQEMGGYENSFRIPFQYKGRDFIFEDIEEAGFHEQTFSRSLLRMKSSVNLSLGFSESLIKTVKDDLTTIDELRNPWLQNVGKVIVPKELQRFNISSNNNQLASALLGDEDVLKIFEKFKDTDSRGHPVMSLEVVEGDLILKFHTVGGITPSLLNLYNNVSVIEQYLEKLLMVGNKIEQCHAELKARNQEKKAT